VLTKTNKFTAANQSIADAELETFRLAALVGCTIRGGRRAGRGGGGVGREVD